MFAQLGDHIFQGLKTPVSTSEADAVKYGQIPRVNDKDAIQPTGAELRELSLTITYSSEFCDPQAEIYALKASMHAFEVLPYITGDGRIVGKFVITSLDIANQQCAADGWVELATVTVNLLESPGEEEAAPTGRALSSQKPIAVAPVASAPSPATGITNDVSAAKEKVSGMKQSIAKVKSRTTSLKRGVREVQQLAGVSIGYLPQEPQLDPTKTVKEEVESALGEVMQAQAKLDEVYAAYADENADFDKLAAQQGKFEEIIQAHDGHNLNVQLERAADALRLPDWDAKIANLSGGERRRVALCRLLLEKPDMLLLDEPTNHLDIHHQMQLMQLISELPVTSIVAIHDLNHASMFCDSLIVMQKGQIVATGTPQDILSESLLWDVFRVKTKIEISPFHGKKHIHFIV